VAPKNPGAEPPLADYYARLHVHPKARKEVIEAAYKALARVYHPDAGGNEEMFKAIGEAHQVLTDRNARAEYDEQRAPSKDRVVGQYRVLEKIAEGGFGTTHKAEHLVTRQLACIKFCTNVAPEFFDLLIEEAQAAWDLRHYAIPAIRDLVHLEDGSYALVMSYIPGPTLAQVIEKVGPLEAEHVAWISDRVLNALKYIHYHGVVHGDIKPQNIIVQPKKHMAVLVDFGLSSIKPTSKSSAKGFTEVFAPPEQIAGGTILPESDLYSLGVTMLFSLNGGDVARTLRREVPVGVPPQLKEFIRRLIVRDVMQRPRWPEEAHEDDIIDQLRAVRRGAFGREQSKMKPIPGF
jgi:serine/threonine protein kinase